MNKTRMLKVIAFLVIAVSIVGSILIITSEPTKAWIPANSDVRAFVSMPDVRSGGWVGLLNGSITVEISMLFTVKGESNPEYLEPFDHIGTQILLTGDETPLQLNRKITAGVKAKAQELGYNLVAGDVLLIPFERGVN